MKSKALALMAIIFLSACGPQIDDPRIDFPVVSEEFTKPVEHIKTIVPSEQTVPNL